MRIQLVAVGLDILRNAQASSSVRLCDSMVTPDKEKPAGCGFVMRRMGQAFLYTSGRRY